MSLIGCNQLTFVRFTFCYTPPVRIQPFFLKEKIMAGHWFQFQNKTNKSSAGQLVCKKSWSMFFEKESRCNKATNIVTDKEKKKSGLYFLSILLFFILRADITTYWLHRHVKQRKCLPGCRLDQQHKPKRKGTAKKNKQINRMNHWRQLGDTSKMEEDLSKNFHGLPSFLLKKKNKEKSHSSKTGKTSKD